MAKFQSTPPRRRRLYTDKDGVEHEVFQSTPPRSRRQHRNKPRYLIYMISIHASAKEATSLSHTINLSFRISIHASAKEATESFIFVFFIMLFQSTPPRRRRPQHIVIPQLSCTYLVSTTFLSTFFSFISQYVVLFFLF